MRPTYTQEEHKFGIVFGPSKKRQESAENSQQDFIEHIRAYAGNAFVEYEGADNFAETLEAVLKRDLANIAVPLYPNRLFLSHSTEDLEFATRLRDALIIAGYEVWLDKLSIHVGEGLLTAIRKGIQRSAFVIVVLSEDAVRSPWVRKEIELAIELGKKWNRQVLIPVLSREFKLPPGLVEVKAVKYANFAKNWKAGMRDLLASLSIHSE